MLWGDPHIITIDEHTYSFNGIGDYVMLRTMSPGSDGKAEFELQARMEPIVRGNATIYTGFAASVRGGFTHIVELDATKTGKYLIHCFPSLMFLALMCNRVH